MADLVFYGNITVSVLGFDNGDLVTKGYADDNFISSYIISDSWSGGTLTAKASSSNLGLVKTGYTLSCGGGIVSPANATTSMMGVIKPGDCLTVSGGVLRYSVIHKKIYTTSSGSLSITGEYGVYYHALINDTTFTFNAATLSSNLLYASNVCEFDLVVVIGSTAWNITFPNNVSWGSRPTSFSANTTYIFRFRSFDRGTNWFGECLNKAEEDRTNSIGILIDATANEEFELMNSCLGGENLLYPVTVNWGDGSTDTYTTGASWTHTYTSSGSKRIVVRSENGYLPYIYFNVMNEVLLSVDWADAYWYDWDGSAITDVNEGFSDASALTNVPGSFYARNNISDFGLCFDGCSSLTSIPDDFFTYSTSITRISSCFKNCSSLENIPSSLVGKLSANANVVQCCEGCSSLTSIPTRLFDGLSSTTDFTKCFKGCSSLTSIPERLFEDASSATDFSYCFNGCSGLTEIPSDLFKNTTSATNFSYCFAGCSGIEEIPGRLFTNTTNATTFNYCFQSCTGLETIPSRLFRNVSAATSFIGCFGSCSSLTTVPANLFDSFSTARFSLCFSYCTSLAPDTTAPFVPPVWEKDSQVSTAYLINQQQFIGVANAVKPYIPDRVGGSIPQYYSNRSYAVGDKVWDTYNSYCIRVYTCISASTGNSPSNTTYWTPGYVNITSHDKFVTTLSDATTHTGTSLRDALANADSGDIIHFAVSGTITLEQEHLQLRTGVTVDGDKRITIDADENCGIFVCVANNCVLRGLTLINSFFTSAAWSAIYVTRPITIIDCTFNDDRGRAGAIFSTNQLTLSGCTFTNNIGSGYGGAIYNEGGITLTDCTFTGNSEPSQNGYGGAIYATQTLTATDCDFTSNLATNGSNGKGGAVCGIAGSPSWTFTRCTFTNNSAKVRGGALNHERDGSITCIDCTFTGNTVTDGNAGAINVGSDSFHPTLSFSGCTFDGNSCDYSSGNTGVINLYKCASLDMRDCTFSNNESLGTAPVLRITGYASQGTFSIDRCMFTGNNGNGVTDGQIYVNGTVVATISNSVFTANTWNSSKGGYHGCIYISANSANNITVRNCTFTNNTYQRGWHLAGSSAKLNVYNSVDYNNGSSCSNASGSVLTVSHCISDKGSWADLTYNSSAPLFDSDGYTPAENSQVIDAGSDTYVTSELDFNGMVRIQGSAVDLGAVEHCLPAIEGLRVLNTAPESSPIIYQSGSSYPVNELVEVEGTEQGDDVTYGVENFLYGGSIPVITEAGTYIVTVTVEREGYRKSVTKNKVAIKKNTGTIQMATSYNVGDVVTIGTTVPDDAQGYVSCVIDGQTYTGSISNGHGYVDVENLAAGTYTCQAVAHCTNYTDITTTATITVSKVNAQMNLTVNNPDTTTYEIFVMLPEDADYSIISCVADGTTYYGTAINNGVSTITLTSLSSGTHTIQVNATGSAKYNDATNSTTIEVSDAPPFIIPGADDPIGGDDGSGEIIL